MSSADLQFSPATTSRWGVEIVRNVAKLAGASGISCLLTIATAPLLTRMYTPDELGIYGAFISFLFAATAPASLRYEFAIPVADNGDDARNLVCLALIVLVGISAVAGPCLVAGVVTDSTWTVFGPLSHTMWLISPAMLALGTFQVLYYWSVRERQFSRLATIGLFRNSTESVLQIILGGLAFGVAGLIGSSIVSYAVGAGALLVWTTAGNTKLVARPRWRELLGVGYEYRRFALYSTPSTICNSAGAYLPLLFVAVYFGAECAGWLLLADRVFSLPGRVVGRAVSDVYFGEAARRLRERPQDLYTMIRQSSKVLFIASAGIFIAALASGPLFPRIFGSQWSEAGVYAQILATAFAGRFLVQSMSQLTTYGLNHWQFGWDVFRLATVCSTLLICAAVGCSPRDAIAWYAVAATISFLLLYVLNVLAVHHTVQQRLQLATLEPSP